jgi:hypothetical protein
MKTWSPAQDDMMREFYPYFTMAEMKVILINKTECAIYNRSETLNVRKSQEYLDSPKACRLKRGDEVGKEYRFKKGQAVWNKGMKGLQIGGAETQFKKGSRPPNYKPVGTIREVDGYLEIKMAEGMRQWKQLNRVIWERCNGLIPKNMNVTFLDGNKKNVEITNMALMTKSENMKRNTVHNYPEEIVHLVQLKAALNRQINKRTK